VYRFLEAFSLNATLIFTLRIIIIIIIIIMYTDFTVTGTFKTMQCNAMMIMGAGVSLYALINFTNNCEKLLQFTL